jgi:hypothetical protein
VRTSSAHGSGQRGRGTLRNFGILAYCSGSLLPGYRSRKRCLDLGRKLPLLSLNLSLLGPPCPQRLSGPRVPSRRQYRFITSHENKQGYKDYFIITYPATHTQGSASANAPVSRRAGGDSAALVTNVQRGVVEIDWGVVPLLVS